MPSAALKPILEQQAGDKSILNLTNLINAVNITISEKLTRCVKQITTVTYNDDNTAITLQF